MVVYIIIGVLIVIGLWVILSYNRLITLRNRAREAASDIEVQQKRRYDLIPNLVETVKGYMVHERGVFEKVTEARSKAMGASGRDKAEAENMLTNTLRTLFAVAENYPELKANANFLDLQRELSDTENKIQAARRFYNANVRDMNIAIESFPTNVIANVFGFKQMSFYDAEPEVERAVSVKF